MLRPWRTLMRPSLSTIQRPAWESGVLMPAEASEQIAAQATRASATARRRRMAAAYSDLREEAAALAGRRQLELRQRRGRAASAAGTAPHLDVVEPLVRPADQRVERRAVLRQHRDADRRARHVVQGCLEAIGRRGGVALVHA